MSRVDLIIAAGVAAVTLATSLYLAPRGYHAGFVDMAHDGYQLRQVLDLSRGAVIFRDTFDQYGPLNGYLNTVGFLALGRRLLAVKYFICGWYALIAVALFVLARRWLSPTLAAFSMMVWLGLAPFYQHGIMISAHVYVLFFQALATIVALRAPRLEPGRYALVGVLAGLSWSMKQSMGTLFVASILMYLSCRLVLRRDGWRRVATAAMTVSMGYVAVIGVLLALLWTRGALGDWYLQTVAFPREFYLVDYARRVDAARQTGVMSHLVPPLFARFMVLQATQAPYWLAIRAVVLVTAVVQVVRRRPADDLLLMASITAFLWLGAFPSANFMHQWWTASLTIAPFVVCVQKPLTRLVSDDDIVSLSTVALVSVIVGPGVVDRMRAADFRAKSLTQTMAEPPMFRGIRTDAPTKRAFDMLYQVMMRYRSHHPDAKVVSIDSSDGLWTGIAEGLPLLSFFDGNTHSQPVYWSLPILSTTTYPRYAEALWAEVRAEHPLIVEHRDGGYKPIQISGYAVLAAVQSDFGYWYLYAPDHADRAQHGEVSTFLARDGSTESGFAEDGAGPKLDARLNPSAVGAWHGAISKAAGSVNVYTWPADLPLGKLDRAIEPVSADPFWRAHIVREVGVGAWTVDGQAQGRFEYLLQFREQPIARGARLIVRGELYEGGFQVGFVQEDQWSGFVTVTQEGPFEAVLEIQRPGRYRLILANCIESSWWQTTRRHWVRGTLGMLTGGFMPNRFHVSEAGWIQPQA